MSSESDKVFFEEALAEQDNTPLFNAKRWTYVVDSSNSNGTYSGQLQFDLNTLSSQNQWTDLSQAYIQFPVKLTITGTTAGTAAAAAGNLSACIKNGFHQFVDSVQVVLGGSTIQSSQNFENINATYKMLSEWSPVELAKYGPSLGIALDDFAVPVDSVVSETSSLDNAAVITASNGFSLASTATNPGLKSRAHMLNNTSASTGLGKAILGSNHSALGKSSVQGATTANSDQFVLHALGTIRLKDISDAISKIPAIKNLKGFIYVNYNASTTTITGSATAASPSVITFSSAPTTQNLYGRCCPAMLNLNANNNAGGYQLAATATTITFKAEIAGTASSTLTTAKPIMQTARLISPYYIASPEVDRALSQKKTVRYNERFVSQFTIDKNGNVNQTLSPGITNPKRVVLYPYFTGAGDSGNSGFLANPLQSPFDGCPATTSPFAALQNLQIYVGNQPMFQQPINMDYETFMNEVAQQGEDGGLVSQTGSGLLNQRLWNQLYRYYTCDVSRRVLGDDGASKSVQISATNATSCPMSVVSMIWYEREIVVDTAMGQITQQM